MGINFKYDSLVSLFFQLRLYTMAFVTKVLFRIDYDCKSNQAMHNY